MSSKKAVLGRGLSALLPAQDERPEAAGRPHEGDLPKTRLYHFEDRVRLLGRVADLEVDQVRPNPYQPRRDFDEQALDELSASIQQLGIIQPITVRALGEGQFEIISGERRLRAGRRAGLKRIPAYIREADTEAMLEMAIVENIQREELNPVEVALGYQRLMEECSLTQEQVAKKVGKSRASIANHLRLLKLPPRVQVGLRDGTLSAGHARALAALDNEAAQIDLLTAIEQEQLSVREVEDRVREQRQAPTPAPPAAPAPPTEPSFWDRDQLQIQAFTDELRSLFSTKVHIRHKADGSGRVELNYYSQEDLERLLDLLRS
ncbi:MAG: ParB/RepB/Spo0J family partition protein [Bacteroidota bacterium]